MSVATWEEHLVKVQVTAADERFTVAEVIELGKDLEKAVERGLNPSLQPSFLVDGASGYVKEVSVEGDIPEKKPEPAKKAAAKKAAAKKAPAKRTAKKAAEAKP